MAQEDKYLKIRNGVYHYFRRVPEAVATIDMRGTIRVSLKTRDLIAARLKRDELVIADDHYWSSLSIDGDDRASQRYLAAVARAKALNIEYITSEQISRLPVDQIIDRIDTALPGNEIDHHIVDAVLGGVEPPSITVSRAFNIYINELCGQLKKSKGPSQYKNWLKVKKRARNNFINVVGDYPISEITRPQAMKFYQFWQNKIDEQGLSASAGNRDVGNMRKLFIDYHKYIGKEEILNPFRNLSFKKQRVNSTPPFSTNWIETKLLKKSAVGTLNRDAALIFYALIETGCRPSEIANIKSHSIFLDSAIPHIRIQETQNREIKTSSSERTIPLIGVALKAFQLSPSGFPRYHDKENSLSAVLMKWLRTNQLTETDKHRVYSLRHAFEDRMTEAGLDYEFRCEIMGHDVDRPAYGIGGSMSWRRDQLLKIELPYPDDLFDCLA